MKEIKIPIPEKKDLILWKKIIWFKLTGGYSCAKCGAKSNFNRVKFSATVQGKPFIFENNTQDICADCTLKELNEKADVVFTEQNCTCDWCKQTKNTTSFPRDKSLESSIYFGSNSWNGHHICQECLNMGFGNRGPIYSNVSTYKNGHHYQKNGLGLWIKVQ